MTVGWETTPSRPPEVVQSLLWVDLLIGVKSQLRHGEVRLLEQVAVLGHGGLTFADGWETTPQQTEAVLFQLWVDLVIGAKSQLVTDTLRR